MVIIAISLVWLADICPVAIEPPQFWTAIANNPSNDAVVRRSAVIHLIDRHATAGMRLTDFARLLDKPQWLKKADINNWNQTGLCGWIPVELNGQDNSTTFSIVVFSGIPGDSSAVYFRVAGNLDTATLYKIFRGEMPANFPDTTVLEIATSPADGRIRSKKLPQRTSSAAAPHSH